MAELADAIDLGSIVSRRAGSSPVIRISFCSLCFGPGRGIISLASVLGGVRLAVSPVSRFTLIDYPVEHSAADAAKNRGLLSAAAIFQQLQFFLQPQSLDILDSGKNHIAVTFQNPRKLVHGVID